MNVSALDISSAFKYYIPAITPDVPFIGEDVFAHQRRYDIVIASHVIQHISDPVPFVRRLQELAKLAVFIVAPFNEPADNLTRGHVTVIDEQLVKEFDPVEWHTMHSVSWGAFLDPPYEMLIARLAGTGSQTLNMAPCPGRTDAETAPVMTPPAVSGVNQDDESCMLLRFLQVQRDAVLKTVGCPRQPGKCRSCRPAGRWPVLRHLDGVEHRWLQHVTTDTSLLECRETCPSGLSVSQKARGSGRGAEDGRRRSLSSTHRPGRPVA